MPNTPEVRTKKARALEILRKEPTLTNAAIAERLGVSYNAVSGWLKGAPREREMSTTEFRNRLPFFWSPGGMAKG